MDWNTVLGWGSPIGLGAFFVGLGVWMRGWAKLVETYRRKSLDK